MLRHAPLQLRAQPQSVSKDRLAQTVQQREPSRATSLKPKAIAEGVELRSVIPGRQPALRPGQRRVEPSQSAPGRVRRPPARPQSPLQGRTAEGVERAGPSSSGHLSPAEGPTHINHFPKLPDLITKKKAHQNLIEKGPPFLSQCH